MTVFVGPSIWRQMQVRTGTAMFAAMVQNPTGERVIWAPLWNDALIGRSRSIMCTEFLKTDADIMVIIDDDIVFEPSDFWKIVEGARDTRGVYGGAYVTRSAEPHITSRHYPGTDLVFAQTPQRRPVEYQYLATGFMAIHRDVFEAMLKTEFEDAYGRHRLEQVELGGDRPFVPFFSPFTCREEDGRLHYLSEDWAFSNRAHQAGMKVWVDLSIILIHMGWYPFTVGDIKDSKPGLPSTGIDVVETQFAPEETGEPLLDTLVADIAAFSEDPEPDIRRLMAGTVAADTLNHLWLTRKESEADWYKREDVGYGYIADLAAWHLRGRCRFDLAAGQEGRTVLDFGCGIGTWSLAAKRAGALVLGVEVNPVTRQFAEWRADRHGMTLPVVPDLATVDGQFDVVHCWHVFEHVADPEALLDQLLTFLKPDGELITDSGFRDASTACHHVRDDWDAVLAARGLVSADGARYRRAEARELVGA